MKLTITAQSLIHLEEKIHIKRKSLNKILKIHDDESPWDLTWLLRHGEGGLPLVSWLLLWQPGSTCTALSNTIFVMYLYFHCSVKCHNCSCNCILHLAVKYHICSCIYISTALSITIFVLVSVFTSAAKFHNWSACCIWRLRFLVCSGTVILVFPVTYTMFSWQTW